MQKILIVEDDFKIATVYQKKLIEEGYDVAIVDDVGAMDTIKSQMPNLVILDLLMPKINGLTILREMKMDPKLEMIRVLILTNVEGANELSEAIAFGASGYLVKADTNLDMLVAKVKEVIASEAIGTGVKG